MKVGWRNAAIGDVCNIVNGGTPKTGVAAFWGGEHKWITPAEMGRRTDPYAVETQRTLTDAGLAAANLLPPYSVILSSRAPIGHLVINAVSMATNQGCKGLVPKACLDHKYLFYYLGSIVPLLNELGTGTTFKELSGGKLKEVPIPIPGLAEQQRVVAILDEAFAGLATATVNAETNLKNARELFQSHLNSIFIRKGDGWQTAKLGDEVKFIDYRGKTPPKMEAGVRLITAKNVKMNRIQRDPEEFIDARVYDTWMTRGYPRRGDVLFTTEAPLGNVAQLDTDETVVIGQRLITMQPKEAVLDRTFLKYALMSQPTQDEILARGTGATVVGIKASLLKQVPISFPKSVAAQIEIAASIEGSALAVDRLEQNYRGKMDHLAALKQAVLQRAFSGELTSPPSSAIKEAAE